MLVLNACSGTPAFREEPNPDAGVRQQALEQLAGHGSWALDGRIAVRSGEEGWHARLRWRQQPDRFSLQLEPPLGGGQVQIQGRPGDVQLRTARGKIVHASGVDDLVRASLGFPIPVSSLRFWVLGLPSPDGVDRAERNGQGRIIRLEQREWVVRYVRYKRVQALELPAKLIVEGPNLRLQLLIDHWNLNPGLESDLTDGEGFVL